MINLVWFPLRLYRSGLAAAAAGCLLLTVGLIGLDMALTSTAAGCAASVGALGAFDCSSLVSLGTLGDDDVRRLLSLAGIAPFLCGAVLGAPVVAAELEARTAILAWSLAASRARWLGYSAMPVALVAIALLGVLGIVTDHVEAAHSPSIDPSQSLAHYGMRGLLLMTRFLPAFALGLLSGVLVRRTLPALLVAMAAGVLLFTALGMAADKWVAPVIIQAPQSPKDLLGRGVVEPVFIRPDGSRISLEEARAIDPDLSDPALGHLVDYAIDGSQYADIEVREAAATTFLAIAVVGCTLILLRRARPI